MLLEVQEWGNRNCHTFFEAKKRTLVDQAVFVKDVIYCVDGRFDRNFARVRKPE